MLLLKCVHESAYPTAAPPHGAYVGCRSSSRPDPPAASGRSSHRSVGISTPPDGWPTEATSFRPSARRADRRRLDAESDTRTSQIAEWTATLRHFVRRI